MRTHVAGFFGAALAAASLAVAAIGADGEKATSAYDFSFHAQATSLYTADGRPWKGQKFEDGQTVSLGDYKGHPILVVNTAAHCGYTPQFEGLQAVYDKYRDQGLVMIGVQANNFKEQGGTEAELAEQCGIYKVDFPQMKNEDVVGENSHPFYNWVRAQLTPEQLGDRGFPAWNFNKVLISADGKLLGTWTSGDIKNRSEVQPEVIEAIEKALVKSS